MVTQKQIETTESGIMYDANDYETARGVHVQFFPASNGSCDTVSIGSGLHRADELDIEIDEQGCKRITSQNGGWSVRI